MVGEKSIEREFFSILYSITAGKPTPPFLMIVILASYLFQMLLTYLALADPTHILPSSLLTSTALGITLGAMAGVVLLQLGVAFIYRIHAQLLLQLMILRYILIPIGLVMVVGQVQQPTLISWQLAVALLPVLLAIGYFANFIIHSYSHCGTTRTFQQASGWFVVTDVLLIMAQLPSSFMWLEVIVGGQLSLHLLARHRLARTHLATPHQHLEYYCMLLKDILATLYLGQRALIIGGEAAVMLVFVFPLLVVSLVGELMRMRRGVLSGRIFTGQADMEEFLGVMDRMGAQLQRFKRKQDLQLQGSLLVVFVAVHRTWCSRSGCLLLQRSVREV